jgi:hypothetical protein
MVGAFAQKQRNLNPALSAPKKKEKKMKNQVTVANTKPRRGRFGPALAGLMLAALAASSSQGQVLPPSSLPYGFSYDEWSAKWWQWYMGQSSNHLELVGAPDICSGPASRVRFLYGSPATTTETRHVTIDTETPLFFAILGVIADNTACPVSDFTSNSPAQLAAGAVGYFSAATLTSCAIDGVAVAGLDDPINTVYDVVSPAFSYTTAEFGNVLGEVEGEYCIPGGMTIYPAVADGVYLMVAPLSRGQHTIHFVGVAGPSSAPFLDLDITYDITVRSDHDCH